MAVDGVITTAVAIVFHSRQLQAFDASDFDAEQIAGRDLRPDSSSGLRLDPGVFLR